MSELTKEWLLKTIAELEEERDAVPGAINEDAAMALAAMKLALASLEAEAVAQVLSSRSGNDTSTIDKALSEGTILFTAPPAPVSVPDELLSAMEEVLRISDRDHEAWHKVKAGILSCRAAMLQGAEPVTTANKLPEPIKDNRLNSGAEADDYYSGYQAGWNELLEAVNGNSPVIPDGWVACSERMPNDKDYVWCWGRVVGWAEDDGFEAYYDATRNKWWAVTMDGEEPVRKVTHWQPLPSPPAK